MNMTQEQWAARVAEIGKMAGWQSWFVVPLLEAHQRSEALTALAMMDGPKMPASAPAVIAAIRQLAADWLAGEGVTSNRVCRWKCEIGAWPADLGLDWTSECGYREVELDELEKYGKHYCPKCGGKIEVTA